MKSEPLCQQIPYPQVVAIVERFYAEVQQDPLLASHFSHIENWPEHRRHISDFWWGILGGKVERARPKAMELGHRDRDFGQAELERWLALFARALQASLPSELADRWLALARQIGDRMTEHGMLKD